MVIPGTYQGIITIGEWNESVQFDILMDPRVKADGVTLSDLKEQAKICLDVMKLQVKARDTTNQLEKEIEKLTLKTEEGGKLSRREKSLETKLNEIRSKLVTSRGRYQQPMILDQISYLSSMLNRADQKPGNDAYIRFDELMEALSLCEKEITEALK